MSLQSNAALSASLSSISVLNPSSPTGYIQTMSEWFTLFASKCATPTGGLIPYTFGSGIVSNQELGEIRYQLNTNYTGIPDPITGLTEGRYLAAFWNGYEWQSIGGSGTIDTAFTSRSTTENDTTTDGDISVYKEVTGGAFPTSIIWYTSPSKTTKLKEIVITRDGSQKPTTEVYRFYSGGVLGETWTDTITYSGPFEVSRTRSIT